MLPLTLPGGEKFTAALHFAGQASEGGLLVGIDDKAAFIAFLRAGTVPAVVTVEAPSLDGLPFRRWGSSGGMHEGSLHAGAVVSSPQPRPIRPLA